MSLDGACLTGARNSIAVKWFLIVCFAAACSLSFITTLPTFSPFQVWLRDHAFVLIFIHVAAIIFFTVVIKKSYLLTIPHILFVFNLTQPIMPFFLPSTSYMHGGLNRLSILLNVNNCINKQRVETEHMDLVAISLKTESNTTDGISLTFNKTYWHEEPGVGEDFKLVSKRLVSKPKDIVLDVLDLPPTDQENSEYTGRITMRRLVSELRNSDSTHIIIGGFNSSIFSERLRYLRVGAKMKEVGWHRGIPFTFWNSLRDRISKLGSNGVWLSRNIQVKELEVLQCSGNEPGAFAEKIVLAY